MRKKRYLYPKPALKELANNISKLAHDNEGRIQLLELVDELPFDIKPNIIESLSSFYQDGMVDFFYLLKMEYGIEMNAICDKALEKYRMSGLDVSAPSIFEGTFYKAFASCSRHTGRITLDIAWITGKKGLHVECFYLTYNPDGVHSFFLLENMAIDHYEQDRDYLSEMVEVSFAEACFLISEAYANNIRYMSRPALGKYLYQKYLDFYNVPGSIDEAGLIRRISARFNPRQLVNSFFYGLKQQDFAYLEALIYKPVLDGEGLIKKLDHLLRPGTILLEAYAQEVNFSGNIAEVSAHAVTSRENSLTASRLNFQLYKDGHKNWYIDNLKIMEQESLHHESETNPFTTEVLCRVYYIVDIDELFDTLEKIDNLHGMEELPYGVHMRITETEDDYSQGVTFINGVIADIVINNGEELVIISKYADTVTELHQLLSAEYHSSVISLGTYKVDMLTAYKYIGGQYINFEDILCDDNEEALFDDGMRFISARYMVKDRSKVTQCLDKLQDMAIEISADYHVYYQFNSKSGAPAFFAEYLLDANWLSISAFGENDLRIARQAFEANMQEYLEFDGLEAKRESIFDILNAGIKKDYPELEKALKEMYLNKWYYSSLSFLRGMSPSEASQTEEGKRLLWSMFKKIKQKDHGSRRRINLNEYIRKLEQKKEEKH
ncbi:MAG: hypothetical protein GX808_00965 [Syntrophomonadaceae bacterium]|jgi:hypothetical protein|nr:hypothetical protein [Syntrophomonadaceae bacterium]